MIPSLAIPNVEQTLLAATLRKPPLLKLHALWLQNHYLGPEISKKLSRGIHYHWVTDPRDQFLVYEAY